MSTIKTISLQHLNGTSPNLTLDANGNMTCAGTVVGANPLSGMRNRIINGDFRIDQRYAGAANTISSAAGARYVQDRWSYTVSSSSAVYTVQQMDSSNTSASNYEAGSAPAGFLNSTKLTVTTANSSLVSAGAAGFYQWIEGNNIADLDFGKSTAKTITISFWVKSSVTGLYSLLIGNSAPRYNPLSYTINSANTWEKKTITVTGDTTGTWLTNNSGGLFIEFWLALGSSYVTSSSGWTSTSTNYGITGLVNWTSTVGNTFYVTGVQIEVGSVASPFEFRQYGSELALCQRYFFKTLSDMRLYSYNTTNGTISGFIQFPVTMRATPTISVRTGAAYAVSYSIQNSSAQMFEIRMDATAGGNFYGTYNAGNTADAEI